MTRRMAVLTLAGVLAVAGVLGSGCSSGPGPSTDRATEQAPSPDSSTSPSAGSGPATGAAGAAGAAGGRTGEPLTATAAAATSGGGFAPTVLSAPAPVKPGDMVTAAFQTRPGSTCQLAVTGGNSDSTPFEPMVADGTGRVAWTWRLPADTERGSLQAWVSCSGGGVAEVDITVV